MRTSPLHDPTTQNDLDALLFNSVRPYCHSFLTFFRVLRIALLVRAVQPSELSVNDVMLIP